MVVTAPQSIADELSGLPDRELAANVVETTKVLTAAARAGHNHWIIAFSGGKDSSLVTCLAVELLRRRTVDNTRIDVVYSDTLMELPPFAENAISLLNFVRTLSSTHELPVHTHAVVAPMEHRFWFLVLGKGYPPPHNHFRWCTERLKIWPSQKMMKGLVSDSSIILTGVRWGESDSRDGRMKGQMCSKDDSECGLGLWLHSESMMGIQGLAPIAHWRTCKVWDFLLMADAWWGWPFRSLNKLYGQNGATRFGCWMCTLVKEDKALQAIIARDEWSALSVLNEVRTELLTEGRKQENRLTQPDGRLVFDPP